MRVIIWMTILLAALTSCFNSALEEELKRVKSDLAIAKSTIENHDSQLESEGDLVHVVYFKVKPDIDSEKFVSELKKLKQIKEVRKLRVGIFEDFGDDRALSNYSSTIQMSFENREAYERYQKHPIHMALKENTGSYMAGPPATYDYVIQ